jgi:hypothetical protein
MRIKKSELQTLVKHILKEIKIGKLIKPQLGSNTGFSFIAGDTDPEGKYESNTEYYAKIYKDYTQAESEILAGKVYNYFGVKTLNAFMDTLETNDPELNGKSAVITK